MKRLKFKSIQTNLTIWFLILALIPLLIGIMITYKSSSKTFEESSVDKLIAIRDLKVGQVESWIKERMGNFRTFAQNTDSQLLYDAISTPDSDPSNKALEQKIREILHNYQKTYLVYEEIFIINTETGLVDISTNSANEGRNKKGEGYYIEAIHADKIYISPIYYSPETGKNFLTFSAPLYDDWNTDPKIIGVLVANIDLSNSLYPLLLNHTGLGKTGETLIVNKDVIALNELRGYQNAPLQLKITAEPAVYASQGKTGIIKSLDYGGVEVLAAYSYISETGWGFVCKQDIDELNQPIKAMGNELLLLFIISGFGIIGIVYFVSKSLSKPIVKMNLVAQKIARGDFSARNIIHSVDELGSLALEFNKMAELTESRINIQQGVVEISETMIGRSNMQEFGASLLKRLMKITNANMSAFYILNEGSKVYEPFASVGANEEMLSPFGSDHPQGEFGNALSTRKIFHLKDIPENTIFKFKTVAGEIVPREIITIPVLVENTIIALISLVNIQKFSANSMAILNQSWVSINTSYSNLIASERTRILAEHLSHMNQQLEAQTEELQEQSEELQNQTIELQHTSEELQKQNIELEVQRKQVEAANKLKSEFLSNMSHELRTPLNSIMALSRVLIMQANGKLNEEENNYLKIVERNGKRLLSLINDILDLSKIESGKMEMAPAFIKTASFLQIIKENIQSLAEEKGLDLVLDISPAIPNIESDESRLHQVILNIVSNAVKFTNKGRVEISAIHDAENVYIKVKDSGIGISEDDLPYIFDEFRQADGTSTRQYEGTGLGLAIAGKMMNLLGGNILVESELGKGTLFTINIPIKWHEEILSSNSDTPEELSSQSMDRTILVVDDDPKTVRIITEYLNKAGYRTIAASSGKTALKLAEEFQPFAITLDIIMEDMDGWEVLQTLKTNLKTKKIPVIVVSVSDDRDTGLALGAVGFINKPINQNALISQIREINKSSHSVMIVDDNEFELMQLSKIIEAEKMETILAQGGNECIWLLDEKIPDILILDLMMPDMDGFAVLEKIRKKTKTQNLPVIIVTAKDLSKDEKDKLSGNVTSLIKKSEVSPQQLLDEIKRIIQELEKSKGIHILGEKEEKKRILIVEDNADAIIQVKNVLEREHYLVDIANGGQEALDYIKHSIPDGIILDLMMPGIDGFKVLEKIRNTESTRNIPVLILTAKDLDKKDLAKLSSNNIQQLIHKGDVDIDGLLLKVKQMLGNDKKIQNFKFQVSNSNMKTETNLPNVLVVEDNTDNMITIKAILKGKYTISEASDGEHCIQLASAQLPDIILLDMSLPKMNGLLIIEILKSNYETRDIPIIAVTAQAMLGDKEKFMNSGCDGYVSKPIDHEKLLEEMNSLLNR